MTDDTMLAHLAHRLGAGSENLATEALAFLLRTPEAARGMHAQALRWCSDLPTLGRFRTQDWLATDEAIPDLVGIADDGSTPLILEAKFGAALTPNQPVTYLRRLTGLGSPTLLLFVVPTSRAVPIWAELERRCNDQGLRLTVTDARRPSGVYDNAVVAVATWADLLEDIERHLTPPTEHRRNLSELEQLRGLCEREDRTLFQPFTTDFLGGSVGSRLIDLDGLVNEASESLAAAGVASTKGLARSAGTGWFGRYLRLAGWECLLHVSFARWGTERPTPLWLRINDRRASGHQRLLDALEPLANERPPRFLNEDGGRQIPIYLPHGADRDAVFAAILNQLEEISDILRRCPAPTPEPASEG